MSETRTLSPVKDFRVASYEDAALDLKQGDRVRSYDFGHDDQTYVEGTILSLTGPIEGCERYQIRVDRVVREGKEIPVPDHMKEVFPPANGVRVAGTSEFTNGVHFLRTETVPDEWAEPRVTANANMLSGYLAGSLAKDETYEVVTLTNPTVIRNRETGNLYRVTVEQIAGEE